MLHDACLLGNFKTASLIEENQGEEKTTNKQKTAAAGVQCGRSGWTEKQTNVEGLLFKQHPCLLRFFFVVLWAATGT